MNGHQENERSAPTATRHAHNPRTPDMLQAPFPYFGGKRRAAADVWRMLGDPGGYVEPFAGSAAVLLARPPTRSRRIETINDADGWLVNVWRSIQLDPAGVARHAVGPVVEVDYHARLAWLQARRTPDLVAWLEGDPEHHDPKAAAWWLTVTACGIGDPFGRGPWHVEDGHLRDSRATGQPRPVDGVNRKLPALGNTGGGVHRMDGTNLAEHEAAIGHTMTALADRLARVRIACGDWQRVLTPSVTRSQVARGGDGATAVFLDPPYATSGDLYQATRDDPSGHDVAERVRDWCATAPPELRIILCGYDTEHDALLAHGWTVHQGTAGGSGYNTDPTNHRRERLWASPACLTHHQVSILDLLANTTTPDEVTS